jgi:hypothetical protein
MRPGIGRGGRGDPVDVLTRGGDEGNRAESKVNAELLAQGGAPASSARQGGRGGAGAGRRLRLAHARARPPFYGARGEATWPACPGSGGGHGCLADGPGGLDGWVGAGWVGPRARSNPVDRFSFFRIYF